MIKSYYTYSYCFFELNMHYIPWKMQYLRRKWQIRYMQHGMCAWVQQFVKLVAVGEVLLSNDFHGLLLVYFLPSEKKCAQWARTTVYKNASAYYVLYGARTYFFDTKILICKKIWNQRSSTFRRSWKYGTTNVPSSREISRFGTFFPVFASIPASGFLFSFRTSESHAVQSVPHRRKVESTSNCTL